MKKNEICLIFILIIIVILKTNAQEKINKSFLHIGAGLAFQDTYYEQGAHLPFNINFRHQFINEHFRLHIGLQRGMVTLNAIDGGDAFYSSRNLSAGFDYYFSSINTSSVITSISYSPTYHKGRFRPGFEDEILIYRSSSVKEVYHTVNLKLGLRFFNENKKLFTELIPLEVAFGTKNFLQYQMSLNVGFRL